MSKSAQKQQLEKRYLKASEFRVAKADDGTRSITGYASVFNTPSQDFGGWKEVVSPNAFDRTLREKPDVLCLHSHDNSKVLGRTTSGTLILETDSTGLKYTCALPDTTIANDLVVSVDRGDITGCSFGFITNSASWTSMPDGSEVRTLLDVDLYEVTITSEPAYLDTSISLRSAPVEVRSRIENRDQQERRDIDCDCDCPECTSGDCNDCTADDCPDEDCACQEFRQAKRSMEMRLALAQLAK
jgi:hypothetical protein